jgi:AraC-like DNA-binding protein
MGELAPLRKFQLFDTRDPDELTSGFAHMFGSAKVDLPGRNVKFRSRVNYVSLGDIALLHGNYEPETQAHSPDFRAYGIGFPLKGAGLHKIAGKEVSVSVGAGSVSTPGEISFRYTSDFEHLAMLTRPTALMAKLAALVGDLRRGPPVFEPLANGADPRHKALERLVWFVAQEIEHSWPMPPTLLAELQQAMITSFLFANANTYSDLLQGQPVAAAPWQVRRAEQYIEANWNRAITVEALAAATSVSARSLFYSFRAARGCSPMDFVKRLRLGRAWQKLSRPDAAVSVTGVAFECGFNNPGHFARDYVLHFGERPSETLKRAKGD